MAQSLASKYVRSACGLALLATTAACASGPGFDGNLPGTFGLPQSGSAGVSGSSDSRANVAEITQQFRNSCGGALNAYPNILTATCVRDRQGEILGITEIGDIYPLATYNLDVKSEAREFHAESLKLRKEELAAQTAAARQARQTRNVPEARDPCDRQQGLAYVSCQAQQVQRLGSSVGGVLSVPGRVGRSLGF